MNLKRWLFLWGPVILWCSVIFAFSSIPTLPKVGFIWWDFIIKKTAHIAEYAILFFLIWRAIQYRSKKPTYALDTSHLPVLSRSARDASADKQALRSKVFVGILLFCFLYAISDEFHQSFVIGRTSTLRDVTFDLLGMGMAWYAIKKEWLPKKLYV